MTQMERFVHISALFFFFFVHINLIFLHPLPIDSRAPTFDKIKLISSMSDNKMRQEKGNTKLEHYLKTDKKRHYFNEVEVLLLLVYF